MAIRRKSDWIDTVDDLSVSLSRFSCDAKSQDVIVIGCSLGGWIAAEMAVKSTERIAKLVLVAPVGIKVGDRETRDIPDIFALPPDEVARLKYHDPTFATVDYCTLSDDQFTALLVIVKRLFSMHGSHTSIIRSYDDGSAELTVPTLLLWGANDHFVTPGYYGAAYREAIPGARLDNHREGAAAR